MSNSFPVKVPTRPVGDSSNAPASTAFVTGAFVSFFEVARSQIHTTTFPSSISIIYTTDGAKRIRGSSIGPDAIADAQGNYWIIDVSVGLGDPRWFGTVLDPNGLIDNGPAVQKCVNAFRSTLLANVAAAWVINTTVIFPDSAEIVGDGAYSSRIFTTANVTTFQANGNRVRVEGLDLSHTADGRVIDLGPSQFSLVKDCRIRCPLSGGIQDAIYFRGQYTRIEGLDSGSDRLGGFQVNCDCTGVPDLFLPVAYISLGNWNASTNSPHITSGVGTIGDYYKVSVSGTTNIDGTSVWNAGIDLIVFDGTHWVKSTPLNINSSISGHSTFAGFGKGIAVGSSDAFKCPEGFNIEGGYSICINTNLLVTTVIGMEVSDFGLAEGLHDNVVLSAQQPSGITDFKMLGCVISSENDASAPCVYIDPAAPQVVVNTTIVGCTFGAGQWAVLCPGGLVSGLTISANNLLNTQNGFGLSGVKNTTITGNQYWNISGQNIALTDTVNNGTFVVSGEAFFSGASIGLTVTNPDNFQFGPSTGKRLCGNSSVLSGTITTGSAVSVLVPHGLAGTPQLSRITCAIGSGGTGVFVRPTVYISAADGTNVTVVFECSSVSSSGTVRLNVNASL